MSELERLKTLFDFTDDDLTINRKGDLSKRQRIQYGKRLFNHRLDKWVRLISMALFLICFVLFIIFAQNFGAQLGPLSLIGIVVWLVVVFILVSLVRFIADRIRAAYSHNKKSKIEIQPHILKQLSGVLKVEDDGEHSYVMLDDQELTNNAEADTQEPLWKLEANKRYTIYYVEQPFWIVAVEPSAN